MKKATLSIQFSSNDDRNEALVTQVANYAEKLDGVTRVKVEANDNKKASEDQDA